jgi:exonuclease SbcC
MQFVPGTNVIIGESDCGKSAIIRALRWAIFNRPQGDADRSRWGGQTSVLLTLDDGHTIERVKGDKENFYRLDDRSFHAIKADVPAEIVQTLNIDEGNLQLQLERPFLLDASPGEVARHFNNIAQLSVIDTSLSNVESWRREIERDIKADTARKEELEKQLEDYQGLEALDGELTTFEQMEQRRNALANKQVQLTGLLEGLENVARRVQPLKPILRGGEEVLRLQKAAERRELVDVRRGRLADFLAELERVNLKRKEYKQIVGFKDRVENLLKMSQQQEQIRRKVKDLQIHISRVKQVIIPLKEMKKTRIQLEEEFKTKFPKVCPLCDREMEA